MLEGGRDHCAFLLSVRHATSPRSRGFSVQLSSVLARDPSLKCEYEISCFSPARSFDCRPVSLDEVRCFACTMLDLRRPPRESLNVTDRPHNFSHKSPGSARKRLF